MMSRLGDLVHFYRLLRDLDRRNGGFRKIADCHGRMNWPVRGVYFIYESSEIRSDSGTGPRVVRVGTHALKKKSRSTLWKRISQHRGTEKTGGGNHRGSIFRLLVGTAIKAQTDSEAPVSWGMGSDPGQAARKLNIGRQDVLRSEHNLETRVSHHIRKMSVTWLPVMDPPGPSSERGYFERNAIGLLSNYMRHELDSPSGDWLGSHCDRERVQRSGLWNNNHVDETYEADFLDRFESAVEHVKPCG